MAGVCNCRARLFARGRSIDKSSKAHRHLWRRRYCTEDKFYDSEKYSGAVKVLKKSVKKVNAKGLPRFTKAVTKIRTHIAGCHQFVIGQEINSPRGPLRLRYVMTQRYRGKRPKSDQKYKACTSILFFSAKNKRIFFSRFQNWVSASIISRWRKIE